MKRFLLLLAFCQLFLLGFSQPATDRHLNTQELADQKWFYSIDSAMMQPDKVYKLALSDMKLKTIPAEVFTFTNLQWLTLSNNKIKKIPADIANLKHLQLLTLYKNKLRVVPLEIRDLPLLESLFLGRNKLTELPLWVGGMGNLRRLDLSGNPFTPTEIGHIKDLLPKADVTY